MTFFFKIKQVEILILGQSSVRHWKEEVENVLKRFNRRLLSLLFSLEASLYKAPKSGSI